MQALLLRDRGEAHGEEVAIREADLGGEVGAV
jgi:hypothetical protein